MTRYLNDDPLKEGVCDVCDAPIKERRVYCGKLRVKRIWVHSSNGKKECFVNLGGYAGVPDWVRDFCVARPRETHWRRETFLKKILG